MEVHNENHSLFTLRITRFMPIKVQCGCGKAFAAKDELAGKTVKCPGCQKPLKIPDGAAAAAKSAAKPGAAAGSSTPRSAGKASAPAASKPSDSLFDEIGLAPAAEGTRPCPGCTEPLAIEAVICIKCGYNTRIGRRMETVRLGGGAADGGGHGAVAQDLLDKAAAVMEEDAEEDKKKTGEGAPWWVYLIVLVILIGVAVVMLMRGSNEEPSEDKKGFSIPSSGPYV
jgi:hypothetical protein